MATVIRNPALIHCIQHYGLTPAEYRAIEKPGVPPVKLTNPYDSLVAYISDIVMPPHPPPDSQG